MNLAFDTAKLSYCERSRVGAVVVTANSGAYTGYNGTISKLYPNVCEANNVTLPWVCHAEENCFYKMLKDGVSAVGSTVFVTLSCCEKCARMLVCSGVERVVYAEEYRDTTGLEILNTAGIAEKYDPHLI
jgi:dCMP deaminase